MIRFGSLSSNSWQGSLGRTLGEKTEAAGDGIAHAAVAPVAGGHRNRGEERRRLGQGVGLPVLVPDPLGHDPGEHRRDRTEIVVDVAPVALGIAIRLGEQQDVAAVEDRVFEGIAHPRPLGPTRRSVADPDVGEEGDAIAREGPTGRRVVAAIG